MKFLWRSDSHFNLANLFTMTNITAGLIATYFISKNSFSLAIIFAWVGGAFDIFDGKIARRFKLSNEFGIQLDSFADFLSFVLVPVFLIFEAVFNKLTGTLFIFAAVVSILYVISGLRRLIQFNINADAGEVERFFTGVPTPLGAILLWLTYMLYHYLNIAPLAIMILMLAIGWSLNSRIKIPHP
jgi:CDP-diacylglycerol---serine O-phosphatidyltransferase